MSYLAVAWDIDGTLVDSEPLHLRALVDVSRCYGVDISDLEPDAFIGVNVNAVWRALAPRFAGKLGERDWREQINRFYVKHSGELVPVANALETLRFFTTAGIKQVAVSNSNRTIVDANIRSIGAQERFAFTISLDDVSAPKPDAAPYLLAAERLGIPANMMLAVEDSPTGALAAISAGCDLAYLGDDAPSGTRFKLADLSELPLLVPTTTIGGDYALQN